MTDYADLFDLLAFCAGLMVIMWVGLQSSRRESALKHHAGALIGMSLWLAGLGVAIYLMFG
jgi:hypothetical protein